MGQLSKLCPQVNSLARYLSIKFVGYRSAMEHIQLDLRATIDVDPIQIDSDYESSLEHVRIAGGRVGVNLTRGPEARFSHVSISGSTAAGFWIQNVPDVFLLNCSTDGCRFGLRGDGGSITAESTFMLLSVKEHGYYLSGPGSAQFYGCHADTNGHNGFHIINASNTQFTDCWSFRNSDKAPGHYHNWHINGAINSSLIGCSSTEESNLASSFSFNGTIRGLVLIGAYGAGKSTSGSTTGVQFIGSTGALATKSSSQISSRSRHGGIVSNSTCTVSLDLGYTPRYDV